MRGQESSSQHACFDDGLQGALDAVARIEMQSLAERHLPLFWSPNTP
jgi:hypothetical protein